MQGMSALNSQLSTNNQISSQGSSRHTNKS